MPEVAEAEARAVVYARVRAPGSDEWKNLQLIVIEDYENSRISKVRSEEGDWPPPRRDRVPSRRRDAGRRAESLARGRHGARI